MPVQHTFFGRPIPRISSRRTAQLLASVALFALVTLIFTIPTSIPGPSISKFAEQHKISLTKIPSKLPSSNILHPFRPAAHAPPVQENSTSGEASWYSNWNWLSPFSSSVTLDENRALLPPLRERPPIYTYFDTAAKRDATRKAAEADILATWRRAWWTKGFKPIILGVGDSMRNPLYQLVQKMDLESGLRTDIARWLAWEHMGTGVLCSHLVLPMGPYEDPLLSYLRRGEYPKLTRYEGYDGGLFSGGKHEITAALKAALDNPDLKKANDLIQAVPQDTFTVDSPPKAIAYYNEATVTAKYGKVGQAMTESISNGLKMLDQLMNAHLHNTWQNVFNKGIVVLKPLPEHMSALTEPALALAQSLSACPESPIPSSCPPNDPKCKMCVASVPLKISTPSQYRNISTQYTIGTVPHPYTLATLTTLRDNIDIPYVRREMIRDLWLTTATKELLGTGISSFSRVVKFKEMVASPYHVAHSLWFTAEKPVPKDLDWHFGFSLPKNGSDTGKSESPVPGPERRPPVEVDPQDGPIPNEQELLVERQLLNKAKLALRSKQEDMLKLKNAIEAWNLADIEAWKFARAFLARSRVERLKWEEAERKFSGGLGHEGSAREGWGRWLDSV